jgi:beta-lactamase regulating signal transducer with metallopeptidase domain
MTMPAIETLLRQPAAQAVAWALLQFVWQGAAIGALTALALFALRRSASDVRYVVASIGLALMLTLPLVTGVQKYQGLTSDTTTIASTVPAASEVPASRQVEEPSSQVAPAAASEVPSVAFARGTLEAMRAIQVERVLPPLMLIWLAGVTMLSLRLLTGWLWVQRLRTHGVSPVNEGCRRLAARLSRRLHISRAITLLESTLVDVPTVVGFLKPVVLLPASALGGLTPQQLEAILAHELAHIRRHDYLVNLLQTLVETVLFYHPAVWWVSRRIRIERENCCDDLAVSLCGDPVAYATALADLEALRSGPAPDHHIAMAATGGSLLLRVRRLLGAPASHTGRGPAWLAGSVALVLIGGIAVGADGIRGDALDQQSRLEAVPVPAPPPPPPPRPAPMAPIAPRAPMTAIAGEIPPVAPAPPAPPSPDAPPAPPAPAYAFSVQAAAPAPPVPDAPAAPAVAAAPVAPPAPVAGAFPAFPAIAVAPPAPSAPPAPAAPAAPVGTQSISHQVNDSTGNWVWSHNGEKIEVKYSGKFEFTDDDADVRDMSPGGYLKVSDGAWLGRHSVEIRERNGQLERRYYVNASERPFEPEGRAWLQQNLPKFIRNTGIAAPTRVARYLKSGGVNAVLGEIGRISGSYAKGLYYRELFKQATLSPDQYRQIMAQASTEMRSSDYELAQLLIAVADKLPNDDSSRQAYFNAAASIKSDYELRRVYSAMLKRGAVSSQVLSGILDHSSTIESDYELSELLRQVLSQQALDDRNRAAFFRVVGSIESSYERHRVLSAVISNDRPSDAALVEAALQQASTIDSDYESASFLLEVLRQNGVEGSARAPFFKAVNALSSGYERGRVLQAVVKKTDVSAETLREVLRAATAMSGYELSQVLQTVARNHAITGALRDAYMDAADKLSGYEQNQALAALVRSERRK